MYVVCLLFKIHKWLLVRKSSTILPLLSIFLLPQVGLWALKSPMSKKGVGSCRIRSSRSCLGIGVEGGWYMEQSVTGRCRVQCTATTGKFVVIANLVCGVCLETSIPVSQCGLLAIWFCV